MKDYYVKVDIELVTGKFKNFYCSFFDFDKFYGSNTVLFKEEELPASKKRKIFLKEEDDKFIYLKQGFLNILANSATEVKFEEEWCKILKFNKETLMAEDFADFDETFNLDSRETKGWCRYTDDQTIDSASLMSINEYIYSVASLKSEIKEFLCKTREFFKHIYRVNIDHYELENLLYMTSYNLSEMERFINAGQQKILKKNISIKGFKFEANKKKLSQAVGLPPFAMQIVKELRIESSISELTEITKFTDGNSLRILLEFVKNMKPFIRNIDFYSVNQRDESFKKFFNDILYLLNNNYKMTDLLKYVLRQQMYASKNDGFKFPMEETAELADYIKMAVQKDISVEKYPSDIYKMHNIIMANTSDISEEKDIEFKKAVSDYAKYANDLVKDGFSFVVPENIKDLVNEGNSLHHCIGAYVDRIIDGKSYIFFMRDDKELKKSFVTVEINPKNLNIFEIKGSLNENPEPSIRRIAEKWVGICKRVK